MAERPAAQPAPAPQAPPIREHAPIVSAALWLQKAHDKVSGGIANISQAAHGGVDKILRREDPGDAEPVGILKTPFHVAGNAIDGTVGTVARRAHEVVENAGGMTNGLYRTVTQPFMHPKKTFTEPGQYLANPGRVVIEAADMAENVVNAPTRSLDEFTNRFIKRPLQLVGEKLRWIGGRALGWIGKKAGWLTTKLREGVEYITGSKYVTKAKEWIKEVQFRDAVPQ